MGAPCFEGVRLRVRRGKPFLSFERLRMTVKKFAIKEPTSSISLPYEFLTNDLSKVYAARCPMKCAQDAPKGAAKESMSTQEVFVQQFARLFHHYQEALSPETESARAAQPEAWNSVPRDERHRMVAAARLAILELEANARMQDDSRKYFAKPGEAEWGC